MVKFFVKIGSRTSDGDGASGESALMRSVYKIFVGEATIGIIGTLALTAILKKLPFLKGRRVSENLFLVPSGNTKIDIFFSVRKFLASAIPRTAFS